MLNHEHRYPYFCLSSSLTVSKAESAQINPIYFSLPLFPCLRTGEWHGMRPAGWTLDLGRLHQRRHEILEPQELELPNAVTIPLLIFLFFYFCYCHWCVSVERVGDVIIFSSIVLLWYFLIHMQGECLNHAVNYMELLFVYYYK